MLDQQLQRIVESGLSVRGVLCGNEQPIFVDGHLENVENKPGTYQVVHIPFREARICVAMQFRQPDIRRMSFYPGREDIAVVISLGPKEFNFGPEMEL